MEWMPIESAPKDGSAIVLSNGGGVWVGKYKPVYHTGFVPSDPWFSIMLTHSYMGVAPNNPTHWQPLPPPPNAVTGRSDS